MKRKHAAAIKLSASLATIALAIAPIVHNSEPTASAFTLDSSLRTIINLKPWTVVPWVFPNILDGNCADIKVNQSHNPAGYKKITIQYSRYANMASPLSRTITITDPAQETTIILTQLAGNSTYYYRTRVDDAYRIEWSEVLSFNTGSAIAAGQYFNCD